MIRATARSTSPVRSWRPLRCLPSTTSWTNAGASLRGWRDEISFGATAVECACVARWTSTGWINPKTPCSGHCDRNQRIVGSVRYLNKVGDQRRITLMWSEDIDSHWIHRCRSAASQSFFGPALRDCLKEKQESYCIMKYNFLDRNHFLQRHLVISESISIKRLSSWWGWLKRGSSR